ncbi:MAG: Response regulator receiver domain-containing protein [Candidatus Electronema aureum]|uniref:Response regulator receiver domain-containing protein n=1 Tax=Candidatus Electronema aureum TaxID=2005002 RepID=A0A521G1P7_9BACT|nr:MAG: Response regulator receiver domain-containing protein [Candidatus Electronema aureum]
MRKILIMDDDEQILSLLSRSMELAGFAAVTAPNGREGQRLLEKQPFDLVITDLIMPEKEGMETISYIKKHFPGMKIIAISGGGRIGPETYLPAALELGAHLAFAKPFSMDELLNAVRELLNE